MCCEVNTHKKLVNSLLLWYKNYMEKQKIKTRSGKNTKFFLGVMLIGVALIVGGLFKDKIKNTANKEEDRPAVTETAGSDKPANYLEGVLEKTDNASKGNFKLVSGASVIYLRTSRDYSALIGNEVLVFIEGTLENFKLLDIQGKLEKDGFLKSN